MHTLSTATITRTEARERIDNFRNAINALHAAGYQRGLSIDEPGPTYRHAVNADERARLKVFAELDVLADLMLGLIEERTVSATAMRLLSHHEEARHMAAEDGAA